MAETALERWVNQAAALTQPDRIVWCDGSEEEYQSLIELGLREHVYHRLNHTAYPGCYLHRSHPSDVARTEHLTFICSDRRDDAGPTNNWMSPRDADEQILPLFRGAMKGRTMYVLPYVMGPLGSPFSKVGVEVTDSVYVATSMRIMTRMGRAALEQLGGSDDFVPGLHSIGDLSPSRRFIMHFPQRRAIWSIGSGYGGNALLGKKCFSLRLASAMGREQGWLAEHMLVLGLEDPQGNVSYIAAAFPSACGKTNLAMLVSALPGYRVRTVGDDIAWLRIGADGRLWAVNPEAGFFGVAPGTSDQTNPNMMAAIRRDTLFTNVALTPSGVPWWEGINGAGPAGLIDWRGQLWGRNGDKAAHPNSRFTVRAANCPSMSPHWEDPQGVPISAIVFGGRRARVAPLVFQSFDWQHGVYVGAGMASETTAAATGAVGVTRRDTMAMRPFCGYNMGNYFAHWLRLGGLMPCPPAIFHVNWFRTGADGRFLWPGFGDNVRVLKWIIERVQGHAAAVETPIGYVPAPGSLDLAGLDLPAGALADLLSVDREAWEAELTEQAQFFSQFGRRLPDEVSHEHQALAERLGVAEAIS